MSYNVTSTFSKTLLIIVMTLAVHLRSTGPAIADIDPKVSELIEQGKYAAAEKLLQQEVEDREAPITSDAAIQLEILRRTRHDFSLSEEGVLSELKQSIPDATAADIDRWREAGDLQARMIDGEYRYFRNAVGNLFRFNADARARRKFGSIPEKKFKLDALLEELVTLAETADSVEVYPVKHNVRYELAVKRGNARLKPGAKVRAWLPFPQEFRQQKEVKLISSEPVHKVLSENGAPHRSLYFEETITNANEPPRFVAEFEFVTSAYCPKLDAAQAKPYDVNSEVYREFTSERPPHIVFSPKVKQLAAEIVGDETNPLEKARRVFRWVSGNIPWCSEMEYSTIPNIPEKALQARRGDCGVQGLTFITLCRAAGVPARWQSGWQTKPNDWNMHDWSEFYVEPWGWLPADASYGVRKHDDPRVRDFFCGNMDPYRLIVNLDYARELQPSKTSFRSEPNDFQRGEIEIDGHNLYFDEWDWKFEVKSQPLGKK
jgi:transglutaminase-like putative cysteine protease